MAELMADQLSAFVDRLQEVDEDSALSGDDETVQLFKHYTMTSFLSFLFKNNDTDMTNTFEITENLKIKYKLNCADWNSFQQNCKSAGY